MHYADIRDSISSGDLLSFSHEGWGSWKDFKTQLIRIFTRSEFSHVGVAYKLAGRVFVLEAVVPRIRIYPLSTSGDFYWTPMKNEWKPETEEYALSKIGSPYSQWDAIRAYFKELPEGTVSECAAYVREVMKRDNVDLGSRSTPDAVVLAAQKLGSPTYYIENKGNE